MLSFHLPNKPEKSGKPPPKTLLELELSESDDPNTELESVGGVSKNPGEKSGGARAWFATASSKYGGSVLGAKTAA